MQKVFKSRCKFMQSVVVIAQKHKAGISDGKSTWPWGLQLKLFTVPKHIFTSLETK